MNIFYLDDNPGLCAQYHGDKHVIKMILESAQMLCTVCHQNGIEAPYKPTHKAHPCTLWVGTSITHFSWLYALSAALNEEYKHRYNKSTDHKSYTVIEGLEWPMLSEIPFTPPPQCMPQQYKHADTIKAYRKYYVGEKSHIMCYTNREKPNWE